MEKFNQTILDVIGNTPIVKLKKCTLGRGNQNLQSEIYVKCEFMNPGGSIKDRIGRFILKNAIEKGQIKPGATIIEGTSGNTGVGLAMYAAIHGFKTVFVLADKQSNEKINNLRAFGAKVIVCPTNVAPEDPRSYYSVAKRLSQTIPNSYYVNQYDNPLNAQTHYQETGPEIWNQTEGKFDVFMAGVGTGGTISGIGKYLKEKNPKIKVVGVDIKGSILAQYHKTGIMGQAHSYVLEGIGEDIIPGNVDFSIIDDFVTVEDAECFLMTRALLSHEGLYAGGSSGAAVVGALRYARTLSEPKKILVVLPDSGNRYASKIYNDDWMRDKGYNDSSFNVIIKDILKDLPHPQNREIQSIEENTTIGVAVDLMEKFNISQLPIKSGQEIIGVVSEKKLLRPLFEGKLKLTDSVALAMENQFQVIDQNDMLEKVSQALVNGLCVFIIDKEKQGKLVTILTDIDLLHVISSKEKFHVY